MPGRRLYFDWALAALCVEVCAAATLLCLGLAWSATNIGERWMQLSFCVLLGAAMLVRVLEVFDVHYEEHCGRPTTARAGMLVHIRLAITSVHVWNGVQCWLASKEVAPPQGSLATATALAWAVTGAVVIATSAVSSVALVSRKPHSQDKSCGLAANALEEATEEICTSKESTDSCSVCLQNYCLGETVRILKCGHFFHEACIVEWALRAHKSATICPSRCRIL